MAKGKEKQRRGKENDSPVDAPSVELRPSKFKEATMNSTTSIHPPPDELWRDLGIDHLIERFNEENSAPATAAGRGHKKTSPLPGQGTGVSAVPTGLTTPAVAHGSEGTLGRISRAVASFFNGAGASFSALGKRKAGNEHAEPKNGGKNVDKAGDDRKKEVEAAYREAKELGLLPAPKVFVRPVSRARKPASNAVLDTPTPAPDSLAPPKTPTLYRSPSKKDLQKQKKLTKRVSDLEYKLAEAKKELSLVLSDKNPPVPPIPAILPSPQTLTLLPSPPKTDASSSQFWSESEASPQTHTEPPPTSNSSKGGKIVKKRKATGESDGEFKPIPTDSDVSVESERESKRNKGTPSRKLKRKTSRLVKKKATVSREEVVVVVPDGVSVPPIPSIPEGVSGKRAAVADDGYGGLEHEMF